MLSNIITKEGKSMLIIMIVETKQIISFKPSMMMMMILLINDVRLINISITFFGRASLIAVWKQKLNRHKAVENENSLPNPTTDRNNKKTTYKLSVHAENEKRN
jgi:hypothetical protein